MPLAKANNQKNGKQLELPFKTKIKGAFYVSFCYFTCMNK